MRNATIKVNGERLCPEDLLEKPELTIGSHGLSEPRKRLPLGQGLIRRLLRLFFDFGERKSGSFPYTGSQGCEK